VQPRNTSDKAERQCGLVTHAAPRPLLPSELLPGLQWHSSTSVPGRSAHRQLVAPGQVVRITEVPHQADADRWVADGLEGEAVAVDPPAQDVGVPVAVGDRCSVLAGGRVPAGDPVRLPPEDKGAVRQGLVLLVASDDPAASLDGLVGASAHRGHRRRAGAHATLLDGTGPGHVGVEARQRLRLRPRHDRLGNEVESAPAAAIMLLLSFSGLWRPPGGAVGIPGGRSLAHTQTPP
jgi:hypothetical protein